MTAVWDWEQEARRLGASRDGRFNAAAVPLAAEAAMVTWSSGGGPTVWSAQDLHALSDRIAASLHRLGVRPGDRVAGLIERQAASFALPVAVWRLGAIYVPLFSGFGGEGLYVRLEDSGSTVIVTDPANRAAVGQVQRSLGDLEVLSLTPPHELGDALLDDGEGASTVPSMAETSIHDTATIMYTSGTTGTPKGCMMPHRAVLNVMPFVRHCLAVREGDVLFSGADPGWAFGLLTTGFAPMAARVTRVLCEGGFDADGWWRCVAATGAAHVAAAPTAFRQLAAAGGHLIPDVFRAATSAGEPMDPATIDWFSENTGVVIHDSYGLSELGMVTANLRDGTPARPGSMGTALPGFDVALLDYDGRPLEGEAEGRVAVRDNGFFMSRGYWGRQALWDERMVDGWFLTEDLARRDADDWLWYRSRADDMIITSGYNVGPGEVETTLIDHPLVVDAAVVGAPDPTKGQIVVAHVVLAPEGAQDDADLAGVLRTWVGERAGWHAAPRAVHVHDVLPRTASGKVQRALLRNVEAGAGR